MKIIQKPLHFSAPLSHGILFSCRKCSRGQTWIRIYMCIGTCINSCISLGTSACTFASTFTCACPRLWVVGWVCAFKFAFRIPFTCACPLLLVIGWVWAFGFWRACRCAFATGFTRACPRSSNWQSMCLALKFRRVFRCAFMCTYARASIWAFSRAFVHVFAGASICVFARALLWCPCLSTGERYRHVSKRQWKLWKLGFTVRR